MKYISLFLISTIFMFCNSPRKFQNNDLPEANFFNGPWKLKSIVLYTDGDSIQKDILKLHIFNVNFTNLRWRKNYLIGNFTIVGDTDINSKYYCNIQNNDGNFEIFPGQKYLFHLKEYSFARLDKADLYLAFLRGFNSKGTYQKVGDTLIFTGYSNYGIENKLQSRIYLIRE